MEKQKFLFTENGKEFPVYAVSPSYLSQITQTEITSLTRLFKNVEKVYSFLMNGFPVIILKIRSEFVVYQKRPFIGGKLSMWKEWRVEVQEVQ